MAQLLDAPMIAPVLVGRAPQLEALGRLIASAAHAERYGPGCVPRLWHLRSEALAALGQADQAEAAPAICARDFYTAPAPCCPSHDRPQRAVQPKMPTTA